MKAIVLAAGYATRLYPLTKDRPKALLPIGGRAMLDYLMDQIATIAQIDTAYVVSNHRFAAQFEAWAREASGRYARLRIEVLDDGTDSNQTRLGALGDVRFALDARKIDDDVLVAASDDFITFPLADFVRDFDRHGYDTLLGAHIASLEDLRRFAVATLDADGFVSSLVEKPEDPASDIAIYALYLYRRDTLPLLRQYLDEGNPPDAPGHFPEWLYRRRKVRVYLFQGECIDIGTPQAYEEICARFS